MGKSIGIDLGTTNSVAAICHGPQPKVLENRDAQSQTPSAVCLRRKKGKRRDSSPEILVGQQALDSWDRHSKDTILSVKRLMGRGIADSEVNKVQISGSYSYEIVAPTDGTEDSIRVVMGDREYSPEQISALILQKIKADVEYRLGEEVTHAVITVPAYFSQIQKAATNRAAIEAGLNVLALLDEPTAAAIAFSHDATASDEPNTILVYDLGGGTFDISILMWANEVFAPLNLQGDMWLGGDNFDQFLIDHIVSHVKAEYGMDPTTNNRFMAVLKKSARAAKERLSASRSAEIIVSGLLMDADNDIIDVEVEFSREEFEEMIRPLIDRTVRLTEQALEEATLTPDDIDFVLMAGNSSLIPKIQDAMIALFGPDKVKRNIHPKHCVALGAATVASGLPQSLEIVCREPDPSEPRRECGMKNPLDAKICQQCSSPIISEDRPSDAENKKNCLKCHSRNQEDATHCESCGEPFIVIGKLAPFNYGIETTGDHFNIFTKKNDPYETPKDDRVVNTFGTQKPNQRMISIPVYGGDNLDKASANEKQGEAFAILPQGLPKGSPVHICLWLNKDGIFELSAQLDDGTDLKPLILHGEIDQKAVQAMESLEEQIASMLHGLTPDQREQIERQRENAFEKMRQGKFNESLDDIRNVEVKKPQPFDLKQKAEQYVMISEFILNEYKWALRPDKSFQLGSIVAEVKQALQQNDLETLKSKVAELENALTIPKFIWDMIDCKSGINGRIRPFNPSIADDLMDELNAIEIRLKKDQINAPDELERFKAKLEKAIEEIVPSEKNVCAGCDTELKGKPKCPKCGRKVALLTDITSDSLSDLRL